MPPKLKDAIVVIADVRKNESQPNAPDNVFLHIKDCAKQIILRKVLSKAKVDLALILLGSEYSDNNVDEDLSYDHISVIRDLQPPSWGMVEDVISRIETPSTCGGDILEAIVVAMSVLRNQGELAYSTSKVVLVTHAGGSSQFEGLDLILGEMKKMKIELTVIGPNIAERTESQGDNNTDQQTERSVVAHLAVETEGLVCGFEVALEQLANFEIKKTRPVPWKACFEIGPDIKIPILSYIKISPAESALAKIERISEDDGSRAERDYVYTVHSATSADEKPVEKEEIIEGYNYGSTIVPLSADEKAVLDYNSGPRSLKLLYFAKAAEVPFHLCVGNGTACVFPAEEERTRAAFSALVYAMAAENVVAIARKVYNNNNCPTLVMLSPEITENNVCLVCVTLPYGKEVKRYNFKPLVTPKSKPTAEQLQAIDDLITNMNLMEVPDEDEDGDCAEFLVPESTLDPAQQHFNEVICDRALNPDKTEVPPTSENVLKMLKPPAAFEEQVKPVLEQIQSLFPLVEKAPKEGPRKAAADVFKQSSDLDTTQAEPDKPSAQPSTIKKIGTITPVLDFDRMLEEKQVSLKEACDQMQGIIWDCVERAFDMEDMKKCVVFVQALRGVCAKQDPQIFNSWILKLKSDLPQSKKSFLKLLVDENIALITRDESEQSSVTKAEAEALLLEDDVEMKEEPAQNDDLDDLLNDM